MEPVHLHYNDGLEMQQYGGMEVNQYQGMPVHQYQSVNDHQYQGIEVNQYPGNGSDEGEEKRGFHSSTNVYEEDPRSRLHRDLKTRQLAMIALGG